MLIGSGVLSWPASERRCDRYGCVNLFPDENSNEAIVLNLDADGKKGKLYVIITETRKSHHIGDLFRGIFPSIPNIGDKIILGDGTLFSGEYNSVGLEPDDNRDVDWLDPESLYKCHNQTVNLYFEAAS